MAKTNAVRILDQEQIPYRLITYTYDPDNLDVAKIATDNGLSLGQVFKTLVCKGEQTGPFMCVIGGDEHLDLKHAAQTSGNKKVALVAVKELLALTGYLRGGCSPLGTKKALPIYLSRKALSYDEILINAGKRGVLFGANPQSLQTTFGWTLF
ncbi:aminoacyl-tRNA deacylase [Lewinella sp. LCG006]|uniref:aminoacyl-tRNA deacylase n=1 Tax=Lewinella sp. LCG006 TaxID=3231911 RepID=UPI00345F384A